MRIYALALLLLSTVVRAAPSAEWRGAWEDEPPLVVPRFFNPMELSLGEMIALNMEDKAAKRGFTVTGWDALGAAMQGYPQEVALHHNMQPYMPFEEPVVLADVGTHPLLAGLEGISSHQAVQLAVHFPSLWCLERAPVVVILTRPRLEGDRELRDRGLLAAIAKTITRLDHVVRRSGLLIRWRLGVFPASSRTTPELMFLAQLYAHGWAGHRDLEKAQEIWIGLAKKGVPHAIYILANFFYLGSPRGAQLEQARQFYEAAADLGHSGAQVMYGQMLMWGLGGRADPQLALHYLTVAAHQGEVWAQLHLSHLYRRGYGGSPQLAVSGYWLEMAKRQGIPEDYPMWGGLPSPLCPTPISF